MMRRLVTATCIAMFFGLAATAFSAEPDDSGPAPVKPYRKEMLPEKTGENREELRVIPESEIKKLPKEIPTVPPVTTDRSQDSMPTVKPDPSVDYQILVMKPDSRVDYKIQITPRTGRGKAWHTPKQMPEKEPDTPPGTGEDTDR